MNLAGALNAIAGNLIPLLNSASADPSPESQANAASLTRVINALLTDAMQANALDVEQKLAAAADALQRLTAFTTQADAASQRLAKQQSNVTRFVSLATNVGKLIVAAASGNVVAAGTAIGSACGDLGI